MKTFQFPRQSKNNLVIGLHRQHFLFSDIFKMKKDVPLFCRGIVTINSFSLSKICNHLDNLDSGVFTFTAEEGKRCFGTKFIPKS